MFNSPIPRHIQENFKAIDQLGLDSIEASLRRYYFDRSPETYLSTDRGKNDLADHLLGRLDADRNRVIPWLDETRPLRNASILEIGCGTGCSTVALAEQGANVTAVDLDESSLAVARDRCRVYGLDVSFVQTNAAEIDGLFSGRHFDWIIFYAALEHMTIKERLSAMSATWKMLSSGSLWCVIETPNRLWYYDAHTSLLPFHMWLPDELAFAYSRFSPRDNYRELYREYTDEAKLHFLRRGRGVSFHEFDLAMKPAGELRIKSSLKMGNRKNAQSRLLSWGSSNEDRYASWLQRLAPELHEGFFQDMLYLIIEKD